VHKQELRPVAIMPLSADLPVLRRLLFETGYCELKAGRGRLAGAVLLPVISGAAVSDSNWLIDQ
jgi:hypothetical protein